MNPLRRLIARIDRLGDRVHPIAVRDLRRLKRFRQLELFTLGIFLLFSAIQLVPLAALYFGEGLQKLFDLRDLPFCDMRSYELSPSLGGISLFLSVYGFLFAFIISCNGLTKTQIQDELLGLVPFTPRQQVHGYMATSLILSFYILGIVTLFLCFAWMLGPIPPWYFAILAGLFLAGQILNLCVLSFLVRVRSKAGNWVVGVPVGLGFYLLFLPWFGVLQLNDWLGVPRPSSNSLFGIVLCAVFLPLMFLSFGAAGYGLSVLHFKHIRKPLWKATLLNVVVYSVLNIVWALLFFLLCLTLL